MEYYKTKETGLKMLEEDILKEYKEIVGNIKETLWHDFEDFLKDNFIKIDRHGFHLVPIIEWSGRVLKVEIRVLLPFTIQDYIEGEKLNESIEEILSELVEWSDFYKFTFEEASDKILCEGYTGAIYITPKI
jgi:hypothetical protein